MNRPEHQGSETKRRGRGAGTKNQQLKSNTLSGHSSPRGTTSPASSIDSVDSIDSIDSIDNEDDFMFYMKGKTTLFEMENTEVKGTVKTLLKHEDKIHDFIEHETIKRIISLLINLVIKHKTTFDFKTNNDLPSGSVSEQPTIDHISLTTKRFHFGALLGYGGPISVNSAMITARNVLNIVGKDKADQVKKLKKQFKMMHSKAGVCIDDATKSYDERVKMKTKGYDLNLAKCWHDEKEAAELSE